MGIMTDPDDCDTFQIKDKDGITPLWYGDEEIRCQLLETRKTIEYYPKKDWSSPGCQHVDQWGPHPDANP